MKKGFFLCMFLCVGMVLSAQVDKLLPYPNSVQVKQGEFIPSQTLTVSMPGGLDNEWKALWDVFKPFGITVKKGGDDAQIKFIKNGELGKEAYTLTVKNDRVLIGYNAPAGAYYAIQTLKQLAEKSNGGCRIACVEIFDEPAFAWRAFMLDEGRYFKGKEVVMQLLDQMASMKMNTFHWHLVDDQGWRIEIKKYPKLTEIGSVRSESETGGFGSNKMDGKEHKGFYTQKEIKEIVDYAAKRHINIVPEIEMPGHASAGIASYSWLGSDGKEIPVATTFGVKAPIYNVADPKVVTFFHDVLTEVMALFPSQVIHIGGDEAMYDQWKNNEQIKQYMAERGLKTFTDVQVSFVNDMSNFIESKGRRMMGWNEILGVNLHEYSPSEIAQGELAKNAVIHFWKGDIRLMVDALNKGYDVVNSLHSSTYIDYDYNAISLEKAYSFNPIPAGVLPQQYSQIKGFGCQMWGEWIPTVERMNYQTYPRIAAFAEVGWTSPRNKNFARFNKALDTKKAEWKKLGINYFE